LVTARGGTRPARQGRVPPGVVSLLWNAVLRDPECLGARVRTLRQQRGLTLKALGRRAELSHPFLSQLERGLARPSLDSVERIAGALGVSVGALWTARDAPALVRAGEDGRLFPADGPLVVHELGAPHWPDAAHSRGGPAVVYVIRGALEVDVEDEVFALDEGDALHFDGAAPHRFRRTGDAATRALYVATR
jgi:transcriptional regulator with XRE-family HTH domain